MTAQREGSPSDPDGSSRPSEAFRSSSAGFTGTRPVPPPLHQLEHNPSGARLGVLTLTALGVVYGDIGTSPLYAFRECFKPEYGLAPTTDNVYGVLSLILWSLIAIVSVKYIVFIMRADNRGEGGILALLALILQRQHRDTERRRRVVLISLGLFGAALLYGDGVITPAISVLSAVEGVKVAAPALSHIVVPVTLAILAGLFYLQKFGTERVGKVFGPIMLAWFAIIAILGASQIASAPSVLLALNPWYAVKFFLAHGRGAFLALGAVVLAVTGAEALYADMGHFGRRPIRLAWFMLVLPALALNYFGQGALVLSNPAAAENPFYLLAPRWMLYPLIGVATLAAIIASQALISGAFSLTQQAVQLGYSPRVNIIHTSKREAGQIYVPEINNALAIGCLLVVLYFGSASALGAAYGIAVTGTMAITTMLFYVIERTYWEWSFPRAIALALLFLAIDLAFFAANVVKIEAGGWVPLVVALGIFILMTTWARGRELLRLKLRTGNSMSMEEFIESYARGKMTRVSGTAVFMTSDVDGVPVVLLHHLKHNKVLHETVVLLSITTAEVPEVAGDEKFTIEGLASGFYRVRAVYGFMETPDVRQIMAACSQAGINTKPMETSYFLGRERLIPRKDKREGLPEGMSPLWVWRKKIFVFMARNARSATEFFNIPPNRVVELGTQIEF